MSSVEEQVRGIIAEQLGLKADEIKNDASFVDDLGADSLDTVELVMALEEEFETEIPDEEAEKITTVQQAIDYIQPAKATPNRCVTRAARHTTILSLEASTVSADASLVTGLGLISPVGNTVCGGLGERARRRVSGITPIDQFERARSRPASPGTIRNFDIDAST